MNYAFSTFFSVINIVHLRNIGKITRINVLIFQNFIKLLQLSKVLLLPTIIVGKCTIVIREKLKQLYKITIIKRKGA